MLAIADADVGGARIARGFTMNGEYLKRGGPDLTPEQYLSINLPNRRALVDSNYIEPYPKTPVGAAPPGEKFLIRIGQDEYNVVEGRMINDHPLKRKEADQLMRT
jgi:hypothetical protein